LKNASEQQASKGSNPLQHVTMKRDGARLSTVAKAYDPPFVTSTYVYDHIKDNVDSWVEEAIVIRNTY
jgi:hypothetical protein